MAHLGTFGVPHADEQDTFTYFDAEVRVHPDLSDLLLHDFMEQAASIDETDPAAMTLVKDFIRSMIHPGDFEQFWALAKAKRQNTADVMGIAKGLFAAVTARPTGRQSGSSRGRAATRRKSKAGLSSPVLGRLSGRPDLQLAVVAAQEARAG